MPIRSQITKGPQRLQQPISLRLPLDCKVVRDIIHAPYRNTVMPVACNIFASRDCGLHFSSSDLISSALAMAVASRGSRLDQGAAIKIIDVRQSCGRKRREHLVGDVGADIGSGHTSSARGHRNQRPCPVPNRSKSAFGASVISRPPARALARAHILDHSSRVCCFR